MGFQNTSKTDQGRSFVSAFFKETCRILGIRKVNTTSFHPASNGMVERFHRSLHSGPSHYIDSANTNWDVVVPFYLMAYRATPTRQQASALISAPRKRNFSTKQWKPKPKLTADIENTAVDCRLENLKSSLILAYESVKKANKQSHLKNKQYYDKKAK